MSSVGRSGSGSDDYQALKTNFETREAQKEKNYETQIRDIKNAHEQELSRIMSDSKDDMDKMRNRNQVRMSEQEQKYQREIENLKAMYQRKLAEKES